MRTQEQIVEYLKLHPGISTHKVCSSMKRHGVSAAQVKAARAVLGAGCGLSSCGTHHRPRTLDTFRDEFDIALKIRKGLKRLPKNEYRHDDEFREFCGVPMNQWRRYADMDEFSVFKLKHAGRLHWAHPQFIEQMKEVLGLV